MKKEHLFVQQSIDDVIHFGVIYHYRRANYMKKSISISIRVSEEELEKFKMAAELEAYSSYSEFVRRTALIEAGKIIEKHKGKGEND